MTNIATTNPGSYVSQQPAAGGSRQTALPASTVGGNATVELPLPAPVPQPQQYVEVPTAQLDEQRMEALKQAVAAVLPRFFFPVTDVRFTMFKDPSGQIVTKFTSLVTGEVSQIPEPELLKSFSGSGSLVTTVA